jgi:hypothetical protein
MKEYIKKNFLYFKINNLKLELHTYSYSNIDLYLYSNNLDK